MTFSKILLFIIRFFGNIPQKCLLWGLKPTEIFVIYFEISWKHIIHIYIPKQISKYYLFKIISFGFASAISSGFFRGLFNAKTILVEQQRYNLTHSWEDKKVHAFPKGIILKMNVIELQGFELAYFETTVHYFSHYDAGYFEIINNQNFL